MKLSARNVLDIVRGPDMAPSPQTFGPPRRSRDGPLDCAA